MAFYWELDKARNEKSELLQLHMRPMALPQAPESNKPIVIILIFLRYHLLTSLGVHRAGPDR